MELRLKVDEIKNFFILADNIPSEISEVNPIHKYLKLDMCFGSLTLIKTTTHSFVKHIMPAEGDECIILIEESRLKDFCNDCKLPEFVISIDDATNKVELIEGRRKQKLGDIYMGLDIFPKQPKITTGFSRIAKDVLDAIKIAKGYITKDPLLLNLKCVYIKDKTIYASDRHMMYIKDTTFNIDIVKTDNKNFDIAFTEEECDVLSSFNYVDFAKADNFNTYTFNNTSFGFLPFQDAQGFDYKQFTATVEKEAFISTEISEIIRFCTSTIKFVGKNDDYPTAYFTIIDSTSAQLKYIDTEKDQENILDIAIEMTGLMEDFKFAPKTWNDKMKSLPYDKIVLSTQKSAIAVWCISDDSYLGFFSKMATQPNG